MTRNSKQQQAQIPRTLASKESLEHPSTATSTSTRRHTRANPNPDNVASFKRRVPSEKRQPHYSDSDSESGDEGPSMSYRESASISYGLSTPCKQRRTSAFQISPFKLYPADVPTREGRLSSSSPDPEERPAASTRISARLRSATGAKTPITGPSDNIFTAPPTTPALYTIFNPRHKTPASDSQHVNPFPTPKSRTIGGPGRGLQDTLVSDTFKFLDRKGVNVRAFAGDLREVLMRHVRQKEGISQGRETLRKRVSRMEEDHARELEKKIGELENRRARSLAAWMAEKEIWLAEKNALLAEKDALLAVKDALIEDKMKMAEEIRKIKRESAGSSLYPKIANMGIKSLTASPQTSSRSSYRTDSSSSDFSEVRHRR